MAGQSTSEPWGLKTITEPTNHIVDIVFVHGLTGSREDTWTEKKSKTFWPQDLLPKDIPNARIFTFGYDSDIVRALDTASSNTLRDHGKSLAATLAMRRARTNSKNKPLIMVAHSLGGLVCEQSLLIARGSTEPHVRTLIESIRGIIFMGTPHAGSELAVWAKLLTNISNLLKRTNKEIVRVLEPGSEMLANLQQEFHTMLEQWRQANRQEVKIKCFYEEVAVKGIGFVVPSHSAILSGYPNESIHANHMEMARFSNANDTGYQAVSGQLWLWIDEIAQTTLASSPPTGETNPRLMDAAGPSGQGLTIYSGNYIVDRGTLIQGNQNASRDLHMQFY